MSHPIAIIGAGPAGLIAAEILAGAGRAVTVYDRMPSPARKFLMAGRGGLNLTHSEPIEVFLPNYGSEADRLAPAIRTFGPQALRAWCEGLGQPTFVGSSGRVFPVAFKASPLLRAWLARLAGLGVRLVLRTRWTGWAPDGSLAFQGPQGEPLRERSSATLLTPGGASWPRLGSDGTWSAALATAGVRVTPMRPANAGLLFAWSEPMLRFAGTPLKRIALSFAGRLVRGEATVTQAGLEGGAVYAISGLVREALAAGRPAEIVLDLKPDMDEASLAARLARARPGASTATRLKGAGGLAPVAVSLLRESQGPSLPSGAEALARAVKSVRLAPSGLAGLDRAISTAGGIPFAALDETFMLRALPGVFAAGEALDWEAPTGGYLLQASFATGVAAAHGMLAWLGRPANPSP